MVLKISQGRATANFERESIKSLTTRWVSINHE